MMKKQSCNPYFEIVLTLFIHMIDSSFEKRCGVNLLNWNS